MNAKRFFAAVLALLLLVLAAVAGFIAWVDPLSSVNGVKEGETALFNNQRYEMPGLIRNQDYSAVVMGTSLAANYRASWFTEALGQQTLKITFPDGWVTEFDRALELARRTHPELDKVFFCFDPNILIRPDSDRTVELPDYFYNTNPLDDVEFYLNTDSVILSLKTLKARQEGRGVDLDSAYVWDGNYRFDAEQAYASYPRPAVSETALPADAYLAAAEENLAVVTSWLEEHPDTQFTIWFPPYSIFYWDKMVREGRVDAVLTAVDYAVERLLEYDNVSVHCFLDDYETICDLNNYHDHIHCSGAVTKHQATQVMAGGWQLTEENYRSRLDELREFALHYDYTLLFPEEE